MDNFNEINALKGVHELEDMISSPGWQKHLKPLLEARREAMLRHLRNPSKQRKDAIPDGYISGQLDILDLLLEHPQLMIDTVRASLVEEKLAFDREMQYTSRAQQGYGSGTAPEGDEYE